ADSLIEQARQLQQHLAALSITDTCQLPRAEILDDLERSANVAKRTISSAEYFCHAAGISIPLGVLELRNLLKALALLRETPPTVLSARAAMLYEPHAEEQLAAFAREAAELRNDLSELGCKVDLNRIASAAELRHYSRTLIAANLFTRLFSADYRAAK